MITRLNKELESVYTLTSKMYDELATLIKRDGGEIFLDNFARKVRHVWLDGNYKLQGDYICRIRVADCSFNGQLEVLPEYTDPADDLNWVKFSDESDFIQFNLDEIIRTLYYVMGKD